MGKGLHDGSPSDTSGGVPIVRLSLLGGFRSEHSSVVPELAWQQRRSAKMLVKLMATNPAHALHREQILELLWPEVDFTSAVNSFGKALHVARRALEPTMLSRGASSYLRLVDDVLTLVTENVWIDADEFQTAAEEALRLADVSSLEKALDLYTGELLPEDMYESWAILRRDTLADLHLRVLLGLADTTARRGDRDTAVERLTQVLQLDPAREDVHRRLMRMHAESGRRLLALRQYQLCCDALNEQLDAVPESTTTALYDDIRAGRVQQEHADSGTVQLQVETRALPPAIQRLPPTPLFGREDVLRRLLEDLKEADAGRGLTVMVSGEVGSGKSRLAAEAAREAADAGALVLWGTSHNQQSVLPYGPFARALETYVGTREFGERRLLAARYPELVGVVPSLAVDEGSPRLSATGEVEQSRLFAAIVRMLTDFAAQQTVVVVLDDLHMASWENLQLLQHLSDLAGHRRWLIMLTYQEEDVRSGSGLLHLLAAGTRQGLCHHVNLPRLGRHDCDQLVQALTHMGIPSSTLLDQVYAASLGNPLFVTELMGALRGRGELVLTNGYWELSSSSIGSVPRQVERLVHSRIEHMEAWAQRVLSLIALSGSDLTLDELHSAVREAVDDEMVEGTLLDILDSAVRSHILEERGNGYAFTHPLFRAALCDQLSRGRRTQFHRAIARAIEACRPGEVEILAYHYGQNDDMDKAAFYLQRAADRAHVQGMREIEETHLWELLERLHVLGRKEDAERVRQSIRRTVQSIAQSPEETVDARPTFDEVEADIA